MSYSDVEHYATIISGCEALTSGNTKSPDAVYAFTVLQLHASDTGLVAGQEGFMDSIKAGAGNIKEWIKKLIQAIRNYFKSKEGKGSAEEVEIIKKAAKVTEKKSEPDNDDKVTKDKPTGNSKEDMLKAGWKMFVTAFNQILNKLGNVPDLGEEFTEVLDLDEYIKRFEKLKDMVENNPGDVEPAGHIIYIQNNLKFTSEKITYDLTIKGDAFLADESNKDLIKAAGKASVIYLECFKIIGAAFDSFAARSAEWHDKHKG